ncbi:hypothetical protein SHLI107390_14110 [Shewanella livingstonensis]
MTNRKSKTIINKTTSIHISRLNTDFGTFKVTLNQNNILVLTSVEILSSDGWEALITDPEQQWYKTLLSACEDHLTGQKR